MSEQHRPLPIEDWELVTGKNGQTEQSKQEAEAKRAETIQRRTAQIQRAQWEDKLVQLAHEYRGARANYSGDIADEGHELVLAEGKLVDHAYNGGKAP